MQPSPARNVGSPVGPVSVKNGTTVRRANLPARGGVRRGVEPDSIPPTPQLFDENRTPVL